MTDTAETTIRDYYDALRAGEPIHPFFVDDGPVVKVGIGERLVGAEAVTAGLREQTRTTTDWVVESRDLHVGAVGGGIGDAELAWFGDVVFMGWTDTARGVRFEFDTRWSGAMVLGRRVGGDGEADGWRFVEVHVSTRGET